MVLQTWKQRVLPVPSRESETRVDNQTWNILKVSVFAHYSVPLPCILVDKVQSDSALFQPMSTKCDLSPSASSLFHFAAGKQSRHELCTVLYSEMSNAVLSVIHVNHTIIVSSSVSGKQSPTSPPQKKTQPANKSWRIMGLYAFSPLSCTEWDEKFTVYILNQPQLYVIQTLKAVVSFRYGLFQYTKIKLQFKILICEQTNFKI